DISGVAEVYSCAGDVDLIAKIKVRDHAEIADVVTGRINRLPGVTHTATHIAFRSYSSSEVEGGFSIGEE
ncbi:Lrp/AsnC ligand binding domain-containing protein, partial [Gordonia sp. i37]